MKPNLKIRFVDFYPGFRVEKNVIYQYLADRYVVDNDSEPDYIVFSAFGDEHLRYRQAVKIFWTGENQSADFNYADYAIGFDYMNFGDRYLRYPLWLGYKDACDKMLHKHECDDTLLTSKPDFCAFVVSNNRGSQVRTLLFQRLCQYKKVDSGGKLMNNVGGPVEDKLAFQDRHRFVLASENTNYPGYTTEKLVEAFASQTIPVYWGDPRVTDEFNEKAFLMVNPCVDSNGCIDEEKWAELMAKIEELESQPDQWLAMMREPALRDSQLVEKYQQELVLFLDNIFAQRKEDAYRFSRDYWNSRITDVRLQQKRVYDRTLKQRLLRVYNQYIYHYSRSHSTLWKVGLWLRRWLS